MFATVGMSLFGGHVNSTTGELFHAKAGYGQANGYTYVNFNDFPNTINMLFVNVVNNNWIFFCLFSILAEDDSRVELKWYFVIFQLITNMLIMNILVGFIIDNITGSFDLINNQESTKDEGKSEGETNIMLSLQSQKPKDSDNQGKTIEQAENKPSNPFNIPVKSEINAEIEQPKNENNAEEGGNVENKVDAKIETDANNDINPDVNVNIDASMEGDK